MAKPWVRDGLVTTSPTGKQTRLLIPLWAFDAIEVRATPLPGLPGLYAHACLSGKGWSVSDKAGRFIPLAWGRTRDVILERAKGAHEGPPSLTADF